jgi:hypothetical protein
MLIVMLIVMCALSICFIAQILNWIFAIFNLRDNVYSSKKKFIIDILPGKFIYDFVILCHICFTNFNKLGK